MIICNVTWTKQHRASSDKAVLALPNFSAFKWGFEGHFFSHFSVSFLQFPRLVNSLGHSIKPLVGFWGRSMGATINNAKHRRKDSSSVCCFCCRKPALHLHKWHQVQTWYSSSHTGRPLPPFFFLSFQSSGPSPPAFPLPLPPQTPKRNLLGMFWTLSVSFSFQSHCASKSVIQICS